MRRSSLLSSRAGSPAPSMSRSPSDHLGSWVTDSANRPCLLEALGRIRSFCLLDRDCRTTAFSTRASSVRSCHHRKIQVTSPNNTDHFIWSPPAEAQWRQRDARTTARGAGRRAPGLPECADISTWAIAPKCRSGRIFSNPNSSSLARDPGNRSSHLPNTAAETRNTLDTNGAPTRLGIFYAFQCISVAGAGFEPATFGL
ncbi:MAG: hypothetical protein QOE15_2450 [Acidimicrobiaceae bacterium]|nr:hypothetical protein [Acidimicrobiaceae bacterium]